MLSEGLQKFVDRIDSVERESNEVRLVLDAIFERLMRRSIPQDQGCLTCYYGLGKNDVIQSYLMLLEKLGIQPEEITPLLVDTPRRAWVQILAEGKTHECFGIKDLLGAVEKYFVNA